MEGTIASINQNRGMYAVELSDGSYTVFELLDLNEINEEDIISGTLDQLGSCTLQNQTSDESFDAFIENLGLGQQAARSRIM